MEMKEKWFFSKGLFGKDLLEADIEKLQRESEGLLEEFINN